MQKKQIFFTEPNVAELLDVDFKYPKEDEVLAKMEYTVVSGGTERACLLGMTNTAGNVANTAGAFPKSLGYCGVGYVMGLGLLGMFSVQFLRQSGANPLIAVDLNEDRRALALKLGADYAFDSTDPEFVNKVKEVTNGKGVNATVEVTGVSVAMKQALECASWMGRISLLGCTRVSDCAADYYQHVHKPGVKLIGAHNFVRPKHESYPHHWTHHDDCRAILDMISRGRIKALPIVSRVCNPKDASLVYSELANDIKFPMGTVFDWRNF